MLSAFNAVRYLRAVPVFVVVMLATCGMPTDVKETSWRTQITVPVGPLKYSISEQLASAGFDDLSIEGVDSISASGDTLVLSLRDSIDMSLDRHIYNMDSTYLKEYVGPVTIQNSDTVNAATFFGFTGVAASDVPFNDTDEQTIKKFYYAKFDSSCPLLPVRVKNRSAQATINSLQVSIVDNKKRITRGDIAELIPGQEVVMFMPFATKKLDSLISIVVKGTIPGNGAIVAAGEGIDVSFTLDSMIVSYATVMDSLLDFVEEYHKTIALSDSFDVRYIDFDTSMMEYHISTTADIQTIIVGDMLNLWDIDFCNSKNITAIDSIPLKTASGDSLDTLKYMSRIIVDTLKLSSDREQRGNIAFDRARLFSVWSEDSSESQAFYRYRASIYMTGKKVTIDKNDCFEFEMKPVQFPFVSLSGSFRYNTIQNGKPKIVNTAFPCKRSIIDSLRNKVTFSSAVVSTEMRIDISDMSSIESTYVRIDISAPLLSPCSEQVSFANLTNQSVKNLDIDLTDMLNGFPDSIQFSFQSWFPEGSDILLTNERDLNGEYLNRMRVGVLSAFAMRIPFEWKVADTVIVIPEKSRIDMGKFLGPFRSIQDKEIVMNICIKNVTNIQGTLYAIAAADDDGESLLSLRDDQIDPSICSTSEGLQFINLLGDSGVLSPAKDSSAVSEVVFAGETGDRLFNSEQLIIRWKLVLPLKDKSALLNGDMVSVNSSFTIKGTMNSHTVFDSLGN